MDYLSRLSTLLARTHGHRLKGQFTAVMGWSTGINGYLRLSVECCNHERDTQHVCGGAMGIFNEAECHPSTCVPACFTVHVA